MGPRKRGVARDAIESGGEQRAARLHAMPRGSAGGMRQRDQVEGTGSVANAELLADHLIEARLGEEAPDGEFADGNDEGRFEQADLFFEPGFAACDFVAVGNPVSPSLALAGEAAADGGHVDRTAEGRFVDARSLLKPAKERLSGRPGEGAAEDGFLVARRLTHKNDPADNGAAADDRLVHGGAEGALAQAPDVLIELALPGGVHAPLCSCLLAASSAASARRFCRSQCFEMRMQISSRSWTGSTMKIVLTGSGVMNEQSTRLAMKK